MTDNRLCKKDALEHWHRLPVAREIPIRPILNGKTGSHYADDGIRITGSRAFIDAVLSRLQDLLIFEGPSTRIGINYQESHDRETGAPLGSWNCYIQVHQRGPDARHVNGTYAVRMNEDYFKSLERIADDKPTSVFRAIS